MPQDSNYNIPNQQYVPFQAAPGIPPVQQQTVMVKKTVVKRGWKIHPIRNFIGCLISVLTILVVVFLISSIVSLSLFIRSWAVFNQERVVGYITVSALHEDLNCKSYFSVSFEGNDLEAAFGRIFPWGDKEIKSEKFSYDKVYGDSITVFGGFFEWKDWLTFLGFPPIYKISSIRTTYFRSEDVNKYNNCIRSFPVNGGEDKALDDLVKGKSFWSFAAKSRYLPAPTQPVRDVPTKFEIVVTKDTIKLNEVSL